VVDSPCRRMDRLFRGRIGSSIPSKGGIVDDACHGFGFVSRFLP